MHQQSQGMYVYTAAIECVLRTARSTCVAGSSRLQLIKAINDAKQVQDKGKA